MLSSPILLRRLSSARMKRLISTYNHFGKSDCYLEQSARSVAAELFLRAAAQKIRNVYQLKAKALLSFGPIASVSGKVGDEAKVSASCIELNQKNCDQ